MDFAVLYFNPHDMKINDLAFSPQKYKITHKNMIHKTIQKTHNRRYEYTSLQSTKTKECNEWRLTPKISAGIRTRIPTRAPIERHRFSQRHPDEQSQYCTLQSQKSV